jgi:hypothetical protein
LIIHQPETETAQGKVTISAKIEFDHPGYRGPDRLWVKYPEEYAQWLTGRADGFLVALFLMGMYFGEDIEVRGEVSPLLAYNLPVVLRLHHQIRPKLFNQIEIKYSSIKTLESRDGDHWGVGTSYSGGIDSSYTLNTHLPENQPIQSAQVTHGFFLHGFDIFLNQAEYYNRMLKIYSSLFDRLDLNLIPVSTNVYSFYQFHIDWSIAYSPPLIGTAMQVERLLHRFYKPSGRPMMSGISAGLPETATATDHLLSTENLQVILDDPSVNRLDKIREIHDWPEIRETLRVCGTPIKPVGHINCCSCAKCILNMTYFELLGNPNKFSSFHRPHHPLLLFQWLWKNRDGFARYREDILKLTWERQRWGFLLVSIIIYIPAWIKHQLYRYYLKAMAMVPSDLKYSLKSKIFPHNE